MKQLIFEEKIIVSPLGGNNRTFERSSRKTLKGRNSSFFKKYLFLLGGNLEHIQELKRFVYLREK